MSRGKLLIALLILVLLTAYVYLGMDYIDQRNEHHILVAQITQVSEMLAAIPKVSQDLGERLATAQANLAATQREFPQKMNSTRVVNTILSLADGCKVKAIPLVTESWSTEKVGEHDYQVFRLNVAVEGTFSQVVSFVSHLENGELKTLIVEDLSATVVSEPPGERSFPEGTVPITARLSLTIYARPLTSN